MRKSKTAMYVYSVPEAELPQDWTVRKDYWNEKHKVLTRAARMGGKDYSSDNTAEIKLHHNFSGSGPGAFGGAERWPHISFGLSLPEGREDLAEELSIKLATLVEEFLQENSLIESAEGEEV